MKQKIRIIDETLMGSVEWEQASKGALEMSRMLSSEITALNKALEFNNAYSPWAWISRCRELRKMIDDMITRRLLAEGKTITEALAHYAARNAMYTRDIQPGVERRIIIRSCGRIVEEDIAWLRSIGIDVDAPKVDQ